MRHGLSLITVLVLAACGAAEEAPTNDAEAPPAVSAEEAAAEETIASLASRYTSVDAAAADGFVPDPTGMCVTADMVGLPASQGAMGIHYLHPGRLGLVPDAPLPTGTDGVIDWTQPEVVIYEPQADGSLELVAIEYVVFQDAWHAAGHAGPPEYFGEAFTGMRDDPATEMDEAHGMDAHYELHVWTPRDNPNGRYAEFNPAVSCEHGAMAQMDHEMD